MKGLATLIAVTLLITGCLVSANADTFRHREMCPYGGAQWFQNDGAETINVDSLGVMTGNGDGYLADWAPTYIDGQITDGTFEYVLTSPSLDALVGYHWTSTYKGISPNCMGFAFIGMTPWGAGYAASLFRGANAGWVGTWNLYTVTPLQTIETSRSIQITSADNGTLIGVDDAGHAFTGTYSSAGGAKTWSITGTDVSYQGFWGYGYNGTTASGGLNGIFVDDVVPGDVGTISGHVYSTEGNAPVAGAIVKSGFFATTTDANGYYSFTAVAGSITITATKPYYVPSSVSATLAAGGSLTQDLYLTPLAPGTVTGTVFEDLGFSSNHPIAGVEVSTLDGVYTTQTDSDGHYTLSAPAGSQTIVASKLGYESASASVLVGSGGTVTQDFLLTSTVSGAVSGTVYDEEANPVGGASVLIMPVDSYRPPFAVQVTTEADGTYWARVPAGYQDAVIVQAPGYQTSYNSTYVSAGSEQPYIDVTMLKGVLVSQNLGQNAYTSSADVAGLGKEIAFDGDFSQSSTSWTNFWTCGGGVGWVEVDLGVSRNLLSVLETSIATSAARQVQVWISDSPIGENRSEPAVMVADIGPGTYYAQLPEMVQFGESTAARYVQLYCNYADNWANFSEIQIFASGGSVNGHVYSTAPGNPPVADVVVKCGSLSVVADADGYYSIPVPSGSSVLKATKLGYSTANDAISIADGQTLTHDLYLEPTAPGTVTGTVYENYGTPANYPLAGVTVLASNGEYTTLTGENGSYTLILPPGDQTLTASLDGYAVDSKPVVVVSGGTIAQDFVLNSTVNGAISGTVRNAAGVPVAGAALVIQPFGRYPVDFTMQLTTGPDGTYWTKVPGEFTVGVFAQSPGFQTAFTSADTVTGAETSSVDLSMVPGVLVSQDLGASAYTASAVYNNEEAIRAFDGDFSQSTSSWTNFWCAGAPTGWVEVDLGSEQSLQSVLEMYVASSTAGREVQVWVSNTPIGENRTDPAVMAASTGVQTEYIRMTPEIVQLPVGTSGRYVQIWTTIPDNWAAFSEVQIFARPASIPVASIADLRSVADGTVVSITEPQVVTVAWDTFTDGRYYIESEDRTCGIKIVPASGTAQVELGDRITLTGTVGTDDNGERFIYLTSVDDSDASLPLKPLGTSNRSLSGALSGVLSRVWGTVTYKDADVMYVDDGSGVADSTGHVGLRVALSGLVDAITLNLAQDQRVAVTGVVGKTAGGLTVISPRGDADITIY